MALSFVGSHVGTHAATTAQTVNFSSLLNSSGATPTLLQGDIVYVAVENASTVARSIAGGADVLVPSGYTGLGVHNYQNDSNDSNFRVSRKVMGATPDTSVAIPPSNATTAGVGYAIYVFRGLKTSAPESPAIVVTGGTNTGVANAPAVIPDTPGAWIVVFGGAAVASGVAFTNPSGFDATTNYFRSATITTTTNDANIGGAIYTGWTSGSYDPAAFGGSTTTNTGSWSAATLALNPIVEHATSGAIPGVSSTTAGTAAHIAKHATTGTLTGQGSTTAGTAARASATVDHATTGALTGQGSTTAGTASNFTAHTTTGALTGQGSTTAGTAAHQALHATTGALTGSGATTTGSAARTHVHSAVGVLTGEGSALSGTSALAVIVTHATSGALTGPGASLAGTASNFTIHTTSGALAGPGARVSGTATKTSVYPDPSMVKLGAVYGPGGIYTGTLVGGGSVWLRRR